MTVASLVAQPVERLDLLEARWTAATAAQRLAALCVDPSAPLGALESAANEMTIAAGRLAGFARLASR
jgi:hypothetical protein